MPNPTALLTFLYPSSDASNTRLQSQLTTSVPASASTYTYFSPSSRPKAPFQPLSPSFSLSPCTSTSAVPLPLVIGGVEVYPSQEAAQPGKFAGGGEVFARGEEACVWEVRGGFVSREARSTEKAMVLIAKFEAKSDAGREECVRILSAFCDWVKANEPGTLTYSVLSRPGSSEVVMFERYRDMASFKAHGGSKEFRAMFKSLMPHIEPKKTKMAEWEEIDGSFTGSGVSKAKL